MKPIIYDIKRVRLSQLRDGIILPCTFIGCLLGGVGMAVADEGSAPFGLTGEQAKQAARHPQAAKKGIRAKQQHPDLTPERAKRLGKHQKAARGLHRMHDANPKAARKEARKLTRAKEAHPALNTKRIHKAKNNPVQARKAHKANARHGINKKQMRRARNHRR